LNKPLEASCRVGVTTFPRLANDPLYVAAQLIPYTSTQTGLLNKSRGNFLGWEKIPDSLRRRLGSQNLSDLSSYAADWSKVEYVDSHARDLTGLRVVDVNKRGKLI
jgi:hypothetical protein